MEPALILAVIFFGIVAIIKTVSDSRTRNRLIEKGVADDKIRAYFEASTEVQPLSSLKWGMVLVGIGLAAFISQAFPRYVSDEIAFGLIFIFAGIAFLIYYPLAERRLRRMRNREQQLP